MPRQKGTITSSPLSPGDSDSGIQVSPTPVISQEDSETKNNSNEDIKSVEFPSDHVNLKRIVLNEPILTIKEFLPSPSSKHLSNRNDGESLYDEGYQVFPRYNIHPMYILLLYFVDF